MTHSNPTATSENAKSQAPDLGALRSAYAKLAEASGEAEPSRRARSIVGRVILHAFNLLIAAGAFVAYQHFHLEGQSTPALVSLIVAGLFAFAPVRALLSELLGLERRVLHLVHGIGGLGVAGLAFGGMISGGHVLDHAALAPFQIMGAAQALMHQQHPRNPRQAEALRRFATSLPEVEQFTSPRDLTSPANVARAVSVLSDLLSKAQALGETELESDPGFQSALQRAGLTLALDSVDQDIDRIAAHSGASPQVAQLRKQVARVRRLLDDQNHRSSS